MSKPVRYFTDEHVAGAIASGLRKRGIDVLTVGEVGLLGADDKMIRMFWLFSREEQRVEFPCERGDRGRRK